MKNREFRLTAVMPRMGLVQVYSYIAGKFYNPVLYEKGGVEGFDFRNKWHVLADCIDEDTRITEF